MSSGTFLNPISIGDESNLESIVQRLKGNTALDRQVSDDIVNLVGFSILPLEQNGIFMFFPRFDLWSVPRTYEDMEKLHYNLINASNFPLLHGATTQSFHRIFLIPLNNNDSHWSLLACFQYDDEHSKQKVVFRHYDSILGYHSAYARDVVSYFKKNSLLVHSSHNAEHAIIKEKAFPQQILSELRCGYYMLSAIEMLTHRASFGAWNPPSEKEIFTWYGASPEQTVCEFTSRIIYHVEYIQNFDFTKNPDISSLRNSAHLRTRIIQLNSTRVKIPIELFNSYIESRRSKHTTSKLVLLENYSLRYTNNDGKQFIFHTPDTQISSGNETAISVTSIYFYIHAGSFFCRFGTLPTEFDAVIPLAGVNTFRQQILFLFAVSNYEFPTGKETAIPSLLCSQMETWKQYLFEHDYMTWTRDAEQHAETLGNIMRRSELNEFLDKTPHCKRFEDVQNYKRTRETIYFYPFTFSSTDGSRNLNMPIQVVYVMLNMFRNYNIEKSILHKIFIRSWFLNCSFSSLSKKPVFIMPSEFDKIAFSILQRLSDHIFVGMMGIYNESYSPYAQEISGINLIPKHKWDNYTTLMKRFGA